MGKEHEHCLRLFISARLLSYDEGTFLGSRGAYSMQILRCAQDDNN